MSDQHNGSEARFPGTNQMVVVGRLTKDPELKYVGDNDTPKCEMRLAVDNGRTGTLFLDIEAWGNSAEAIAAHCTKGRKVAASGRLELDEWDRDDGTRASRHYLNTTSGGVEFLDAPPPALPTTAAPEPPTGDRAAPSAGEDGRSRHTTHATDRLGWCLLWMRYRGWCENPDTRRRHRCRPRRAAHHR